MLTSTTNGLEVYSYPFVLPYGQVQLRLDNTSFPYADGLNREPNLLRIGMVRISERTTNSHTFSLQTIGDKGN